MATRTIEELIEELGKVHAELSDLGYRHFLVAENGEENGLLTAIGGDSNSLASAVAAAANSTEDLGLLVLLQHYLSEILRTKARNPRELLEKSGLPVDAKAALGRLLDAVEGAKKEVKGSGGGASFASDPAEILAGLNKPENE